MSPHGRRWSDAIHTSVCLSSAFTSASLGSDSQNLQGYQPSSLAAQVPGELTA